MTCARRLLAIPIAPLLALSAHAGEIRLVDLTGANGHRSIQSAIDASADGDVILVAAGTYDGFRIDDKSVSVVGAPGGSIRVISTIEVHDLAASRSVVLGNLMVTGESVDAPMSRSALALFDNHGCVRVQGCTLNGGPGFSVFSGCTGKGNGGRGVELQSCDRAAFIACTIRGGDGDLPSGCNSSTANGGDGVFSQSSSVAFYDCAVRGGDGRWGVPTGHGGTGCNVPDWGIFASGTTFEGGTGGQAAYGPDLGAGGDGLFVGAAQAQLLDCALIGGQGGQQYPPGSAHGPNGHGVAGPGVVNYHSGRARSLDAAAIAGDQSALTVTIHGVSGDRVWLRTSTSFAHVFATSLHGMWLLPPRGFLPFVPAGVVPPSGVLQIQVPTGDVPTAERTRTLILQALTVDTAGVTRLSSASHVLVLDRFAPPDCDGNGVLDVVDTVTGAPDCDHNLRPDSCDPDCDGNGIVDGCDIQSGASLDVNFNGVPDACEPPGAVRWVDASAPPHGDGSASSPFQNLRDGLRASLSTDTVIVRDGVYVGELNRELALYGRDIVIRSENGPAACVLDCQQQGRAFHLYSSGESPAARIEGLSIVNGNSVSGSGIRMYASHATISGCRFQACSSLWGAGAIEMSSSHARVEDCSIAGCTAGISGGAIASYSAAGGPQPQIVRCDISGCTATYGGGISYTGLGALLISHCTIIDNTATYRGGGLDLVDESIDPTGLTTWIDDCLIAGNEALQAGALAIGSNPNNNMPRSFTITGSTIVDNRSTGWTAPVFANPHSCLVEVNNTILWGNRNDSTSTLQFLGSSSSLSATFLNCDVEGGINGVVVSGVLTYGPSNIAGSPAFADPDGPDNDPSTVLDNDYRLSLASPCIDAGDTTIVPYDRADIDGDGDLLEGVPLDRDLLPRFIEIPSVPNTGNGGPPFIDIGCFERQP